MMTDAKLRTALQPIVQEYSLGRVLKSLGEIADARHETSEQLATSPNGVAKATTRKKPKVTASGYVEKMELPIAKSAAVAELAERFQRKSFLPTVNDIANFCQMYGIEVPASKSRASAIPRIFKFIAGMEADEIQRILADGMFSGPSRLGPIADAIRNYGGATSQRSAR